MGSTRNSGRQYFNGILFVTNSLTKCVPQNLQDFSKVLEIPVK